MTGVKMTLTPGGLTNIIELAEDRCLKQESACITARGAHHGITTMNATDQTILVVEGGPHDNESIPLEGPVISMGRHSSNDVVVAETGVSRKHAEIVENNGSFSLKDLASTNGTMVNSKKMLQDGDSIRLGASTVSYIFRSPVASTMAITLEQPAIGEGADDDTGVVDVVTEPVSPMTVATELPLFQDAAAADDPDEPYEGDVQLSVYVVDGGMGMMVTFVQQLRERAEFRVSRMGNNSQGGVDVSLVLREPLALRQVLAHLEGVAKVSRAPNAGDEAALSVMLQAEDTSSQGSAESPLCVHCKAPLEPTAAVCPSCRKTQA